MNESTHGQPFKPLVIDGDTFSKCYKTDIEKFVKTRASANFDAKFISWSHATRLLKEVLPTVFVDFEVTPDGSVAFLHNDTVTVRPFLTDGETRTPSISFPVMDYKFGALPKPDAREISDAMQRGGVKAIATFTGLGLPLYSNEDVDINPSVQRTAPQKNQPPIPSGDGSIIYLKVPFKEKDEVKALGARFDGDKKSWHINTAFVDEKDFSKWILGAETTQEPTDEISGQTDGDPTDPELNEDVPF